MNQVRFEAEIVRADGAVPQDVVRERVYGRVWVVAEWPSDVETREIRVGVLVFGDFDRRNARAYAELFFHDVFLILNLSVPGSFGGIVSMSDGDGRVRDVALSPRVFNAASGLRRLPVDIVAAWYAALGIGAQQLATGGVAVALFQLLHLAYGEESDDASVLRLAHASEALGKRELTRLFELREEIARGLAPVIHPMHDDGLDPRVEDLTAEWIEVVDGAASAVISALQESASAYRGEP